MNSPALKIQDLEACYGAIKALHGVSLEVAVGEIVCLIGANGAGKSTLLMSIFGNPKPSSGSIQLFGENINQVPTHKIAKKGIALVPEGRHIFPKMSVLDNLKMGMINNPKAPLEPLLDKAFSLFPRLRERYKQTAGTLSGGEQQMLAIGRALMSEPKLLLLDEPSLGLAPIIIKDIFRSLKEIAGEGMTIFLVEQNARLALKISQRGYVLVNGQVKFNGPSAELLEDPTITSAYLGGH